MLCNIKPVPFHESDKHIFAKIPGGGSGPPVPPPRDPPMGFNNFNDKYDKYLTACPYSTKSCNSSFPNDRFWILSNSEFADDNFRYYECGKMLFKRLENSVGKGEIRS